MHTPIYLDYNATTPVDPKVVETINVYLTSNFGNPSSSHFYGQQAREGISWQTALYTCLSESDWFCNGGYKI